MTCFGLQKEKDIERWMKPFAARVRMPGYQRVTLRSTKLFFHLYWKLEQFGFTQQQIADHAVTWRYRSCLPESIALEQAVFDLAEKNGVVAAEPFVPFLAA